MNLWMWALVLLCLGSALLAGRHGWAAALNMLLGTVLVLAMLAVGRPVRELLLVALTLCAAAAFAGRGTT